MENGSYKSYQGMMASVDTALARMESICTELELEESAKILVASKEKLENHRFAVGIMGEFKRGKSTVINSLLEQEIMPADILPCSATMNRVTYDMQPHVELLMQDGTTCRIEVEELASYVTKLTSENESRAANVEEAVVYYPCRFCQNGVDIIDTPGLNDDERMNKISEEIIPKLDAVIMVITPGNPFSMSEAEFVRTKLMSSDLGRLIFLVNKIDTVRRAADRVSVVEDIRRRIQETVLEKIAEMYGKDSKQYEDAKMKLGKIRIFPFSALDALDGKMEGDEKLIESSGTRPFEEALTKMLTEERGAIELGTPIAILQRTSLEVVKTIEARYNALSMSKNEFNEKQKKAMQRLEQLRIEKKEEKQRLRSRSREVQADLASRTAQFYPELEKRMMKVVDGYSPVVETFAKPEGQKEGMEILQKKVTSEMNVAISNFTEKMIVDLQDIIEKEAVSAAEFTSKISKEVEQLYDSMKKEDEMDFTNVIATGVDVLTDIVGIYGIGGLVAGYRAAGVKGALVGGGVGLVANIAAAAFLTSMSIVGLPVFVVSCALGTFVSKKVSTALFSKDIGKKKLNEIKAEMKKNITLSIKDMQTKRNLENWIEDLVKNRFEELSVIMEEDCEKVLRDAENSLNEIRKDLARSEAERENTAKRLEQTKEKCVKIVANLQPICEKVQMTLKEGV